MEEQLLQTRNQGHGRARTGPAEHASLWGLFHCLLAPLKQLALESLIVSKDSSQETAERAPWVPLVLGVILTRAKVQGWKCCGPAGSPAS